MCFHYFHALLEEQENVTYFFIPATAASTIVIFGRGCSGFFYYSENQ